MSQHEDDFYRGDPPTGSTAAGRGPDPARPPSGYPPPDQSAAAGHAPPSGYAPQPGYGAPSSAEPSGWQPQTGYGPPPGYGPAGQGYPPQPYGARGWRPGWRRPTNTMAILALVLAFVFPPAALVLGIVARRQIRETGEEGDGLALAGVIVGAISIGFIVLGLLLFIVLAASVSP